MFWLMPFELAGTVALLVLFAIAQPDLYRTQMWRIGHVWGFNSDPAIILYAKANGQPAPNVPFVWSLKSVPHPAVWEQEAPPLPVLRGAQD